MELLELGKTFKQVRKGPVTAQLMKPWNTGAVETGLNIGEAEKPHNKNYPFLLETKAASYESTQAKSFLDGLAHELLEILNYYQLRSS